MPETPPHDDDHHHRDGSEVPISYPTNQMIGVVDTEERAAAVIEALAAGGFLDSDVHVACGSERADAISYHGRYTIESIVPPKPC